MVYFQGYDYDLWLHELLVTNSPNLSCVLRNPNVLSCQLYMYIRKNRTFVKLCMCLLLIFYEEYSFKILFGLQAMHTTY